MDKTRLAWPSSAHAPFEQEVIIENPWQIGGNSCFLKTSLCCFSENVYFCKRKSLKGEKIMAKPIEATPVLEGNDAIAFCAEMEKNEKASEEEKKRVKADADIIRAMLTFAF